MFCGIHQNFLRNRRHFSECAVYIWRVGTIYAYHYIVINDTYWKILPYPLMDHDNVEFQHAPWVIPTVLPPFPQHHQCSAPVTGRARFMLRDGVGLAPGVKANSPWFCLESKFRCFVGRSLCYQLLLAIQYSAHDLIINPLCKVVVEWPCFPAGLMSISMTGKNLPSLIS